MNREEAKELLIHILMTYEPKDQYGDYDDPEPYEQALTMAIEALTYQNLSKPNTTCEVDIISRADAIEAITEETSEAWTESDADFNRGMEMAVSIIKALPSVDIYCPSCGIRLVSEHEYVEPPYKGGDTE